MCSPNGLQVTREHKGRYGAQPQQVHAVRVFAHRTSYPHCQGTNLLHRTIKNIQKIKHSCKKSLDDTPWNNIEEVDQLL